MSHLFAFEKLQVWQEARVLLKEIYLATYSYPRSEVFGITSQMRRAALSISSNLAEGSGRTSKKDQAHFYQISYSSALELLNQLILSLDLEYIKEQQYNDIRLLIESLTNKTNALRTKCLVV